MPLRRIAPRILSAGRHHKPNRLHRIRCRGGAKPSADPAAGAITGRAIYEGSLDFEAAQNLALKHGEDEQDESQA